MELTLRTPQVCEVTGASYRQVDYWTRNGVIRPERDARGSGSQRGFTLHQVELVRVMFLLSKLGATAPVLREVAAALTEDSPLWEQMAVVTDAGEVSPLAHLDQLEHGWMVDLPRARAHVAAAMQQGPTLAVAVA